MRIIIFGTGSFYSNRKTKIEKINNVEIVAFIDNDSNKWGITLDGISIYSPNVIDKLDYDIIILMSVHIKEMKDQLVGMGVEVTKIKNWEQFYAQIVHPQMTLINFDKAEIDNKKRVLIISTYLDYTGGPLTAVYAAQALKNKGYLVVLATPGGEQELIDTLISYNISVAICPIIPYLQREELNWFKQFDIAIVNVFPMINCAYDLKAICPTFWWIHEAKNSYNPTVSFFSELICLNEIKNINVYAVSRIAKNNFNIYFPQKIENILNYGLPDMYQEKLVRTENCIFVVIGYVSELKAQDIFIKAIEKMKNKDNAEFWIIGNIADNEYCNSIRKAAEQNPSIKIMGMLTREEIYNVFPKIDVVVCPSREDCLPIVMTEAMMFGKVCIASDGTGTADFITEGENGFIVPVEDVSALSAKMEWLLENKNQLEYIGRNARKTYEKYFSMEVFGDNLEKALLETEKFWNRNKEL